MSTKKNFIQQIIIRSLPQPGRVEAGVRYAETLWDELTRLGYGAAAQSKPRETRDYYKELTAYQAEWFDKFWNAFGYKQARNRAALAWIKLGEQTADKYRQIVEAAKAESLRPRKHSETRKMAEGWLTEYRFEDHIASAQSKKADKNRARKLALNSELNALKQFNSDGSQDAAIEKLQVELESL